MPSSGMGGNRTFIAPRDDMEMSSARHELERERRELEEQARRAMARKDYGALIRLTDELLYGSAGMGRPPSPAAIELLNSAYLAGHRLAGRELALVGFERLTDHAELTIDEWLGLIIEGALEGDIRCILEVEHLPHHLVTPHERAAVAAARAKS
jgi:hypothetical protein